MKTRTPNWRSASTATAALLAATLLAPAAGCGGSDAAVTDAAARNASAPIETQLRVRTEEVRRQSLGNAGNLTGTVRAFHRAQVRAETQGRVAERAVEPGAHVAEGETIVRLDASRAQLEVRRTQAALQAARTVLAHARREFERGEKLREQSALSTQRFDDLRLSVDRARDELALAVVARDTARRNLADTEISAPFEGSVDALSVNVGDFVSPGTPVATVVDLDRVRIQGGVTAREAARLSVGSVARISFDDLGGIAFEAVLQSVARVADSSDGTYAVELWMDDPEGRLRDGLVARIELPDVHDQPSLVAPRAALLRRHGRPEVFVVAREGGRDVARARPVRTGRSDGEWIEILDGLSLGDAVIWDGHFALEDGSVVSAASAQHAPSKD